MVNKFLINSFIVVRRIRCYEERYFLMGCFFNCHLSFDTLISKKAKCWIECPITNMQTYMPIVYIFVLISKNIKNHQRPIKKLSAIKDWMLPLVSSEWETGGELEVIINFFYFLKTCPSKHFYKCSYNLENKVLELHKYIKALPQNSHALCTQHWSAPWAEEPQMETLASEPDVWVPNSGSAPTLLDAPSPGRWGCCTETAPASPRRQPGLHF